MTSPARSSDPTERIAAALERIAHTLDAIVARSRTRDERLHALETAELAADALVFPAPDGSMRGRCNSARWVERRIPYPLADGTRRHRAEPGYRAVAGIARHVRFHDLRHTCASHLLMGTWGRAWRLEEVRDLLGHSDVAITQRYAHLAPDRLHAAALATPGVPRETEHAPGPKPAPELAEQAAKLAESLSHLRDLNPRPTVYETGPAASNHAGLAPDGAAAGPAALRQRALQLLQQAAREGRADIGAARELALDALQLPVPAAARAVLDAQDEAVAASCAVTLAVALLDEAAVSAAPVDKYFSRIT